MRAYTLKWQEDGHHTETQRTRRELLSVSLCEALQTNALKPVIAFPTISVFISRVPSYE